MNSLDDTQRSGSQTVLFILRSNPTERTAIHATTLRLMASLQLSLCARGYAFSQCVGYLLTPRKAKPPGVLTPGDLRSASPRHVWKRRGELESHRSHQCFVQRWKGLEPLPTPKHYTPPVRHSLLHLSANNNICYGGVQIWHLLRTHRRRPQALPPSYHLMPALAQCLGI